MTSSNTIPFAIALAGMALAAEVPANAEAPSQRLSHEELAARGEERANPLAGRRAVRQIDPASVGKKERRKIGGESLLARSLILSYRGTWTIVPKGAILHIPDNYQDRIAPGPSGRLIPWNEFYVRNRGWIHTQRVTIEHARGETALSPEVLEFHKRLGRVVVAVLHQGPISVKAPVEPQDEEQKGKSPEIPVEALNEAALAALDRRVKFCQIRARHLRAAAKDTVNGPPLNRATLRAIPPSR